LRLAAQRFGAGGASTRTVGARAMLCIALHPEQCRALLKDSVYCQNASKAKTHITLNNSELANPTERKRKAKRAKPKTQRGNKMEERRRDEMEEK